MGKRDRTKPSARTDAELKKASEHVYYEIQTLFRSVELLNQEPSPQDRNVAIDSALLHARSLWQFFDYYIGFDHDDDVRAIDYVAGWTPPGLVANPPASSAVPPTGLTADQITQNDADAIGVEFNKHAAHLTFTRTTAGTASEWKELPRVLKFLVRAHDQFKTAANLDAQFWSTALTPPAAPKLPIATGVAQPPKS